jgi:HK97 family phage major capsid protein
MATTAADTVKASLQAKQNLLLQKAKLILDTCEREQRALSPDEEKAHAQLLTQIETLATKIERLDADAEFAAPFEALERMAGGGRSAAPRPGGPRLSLGEQFVKSEAFDWLQKTQHKRPDRWASPAVELTLHAATLTEDPASGGALIVPETRAGILPTPQPPIVLSQLFQPGTITAASLQYMKEKLFTNAAAPVLETGVKPESTLTFEAVIEALKKIAHWLPVSEEMLEDVDQIRSYIDARLMLGVNLALEDQILNGDGTGAEMLGLLVRTDLAAPIAAPVGGSLDAIAAQISAIETNQQLRVSGIAMNPTDWLTLSLTKTTDGGYLGPNPFETPTTPTLFGRPVAQTPAMPVGQALVGAFSSGGGQLFRRNGVKVDASNSHADFFVKNLVALRAELRALLALYRPAAFGLVTNLNAVEP